MIRVIYDDRLDTKAFHTVCNRRLIGIDNFCKLLSLIDVEIDQIFGIYPVEIKIDDTLIAYVNIIGE